VEKDMIGINYCGVVKVWLNSIYSRNYKERESELLRDFLVKKNQDVESNMVSKVVRIVSKQAKNSKIR
jgi:hypothetical protein